MISRKLLVLPFLTLLLMAASVFAADKGNGPPNGPMMGPGPEEEGFFRVMDDLNLSPEQKKQISEMKDSGKREAHAIKSDIRLLIWDIQDEIKKESPDRKKMDSITDKICEKEKLMMKHRTSDMLKLKEILTKEQFTKMLEKIEAGRTKARKNFFQRMINK